MKLSKNFERAFGLLRKHGINFVYVDDFVNLEAEYPSGSMHVPTRDFNIICDLTGLLWDWDDPERRFVISYNYSKDESVTDSLIEGKHAVTF